VLIVEDETIIALILEMTLTGAGIEVCGVAGSEEEALQMAAICEPTHAICDVRLAPGDGLTVARELQARYHCAIVFSTAYAHDVCHKPGLPPGVCLGKPYDPALLLAALLAAREIADGQPPSKLPHGAEIVGP